MAQLERAMRSSVMYGMRVRGPASGVSVAHRREAPSSETEQNYQSRKQQDHRLGLGDNIDANQVLLLAVALPVGVLVGEHRPLGEVEAGESAVCDLLRHVQERLRHPERKIDVLNEARVPRERTFREARRHE